MERLLKIQDYELSLDLSFKKHFDELEKAQLIKLSELKKGELPKTGGLYVFYEEKDKPIYVGRTKNIRQRMQLHTRNSSKHESATFTFNLAKMNFKPSLSNIKKMTRKELMEDKEFSLIFNQQKERVKKMYFKYIKEEHDILQTILEPYFSLKLRTYPEFNTFETH
jgi:excinuclease UvrABC nuclease subunit